MKPEDDIKNLLKDFYNISGIRISIHDISFKEIYSYPESLSHFCSCVQSFPALHNECRISDAYAFSMATKTDKPYVYKCNFGLFEAVAPIYNYGRLTGYLMLGQVKDATSELFDKTVSFLNKNGIKNSEIQKACKSLVSLTPEKLNSYINIMTIIAKHLTATNKLTEPQNELPFLIHKEIMYNYDKDLSLVYLSRKFGCSISSITTAYKKEYNQSIHQAILNARLNQATSLLKGSKKAMKEISEECGFYDQNHFYRTFKAKYNVSPSEYRKLNNLN